MSASPTFRQALGLALAFTEHGRGCPARGDGACTCGLGVVRTHGYHLLRMHGERVPTAYSTGRAWRIAVQAARALKLADV